MHNFNLVMVSAQKPYYSKEGFDRTAFADGSEGFLFAVIDGMGISPESERVANEVKAELELKTHNGNISDFQSLARVLDGLIDGYVRNPTQGGSTATAIFIDRYGDIHYAHVGDSRLYCSNKKRAWQVTADEGIENILYNYVGSRSRGVCQVGIIPAKQWDNLILVTDGVTGDREPDLVGIDAIQKAMRAKTVQLMADWVMSLATKTDDRSIIAIRKEAL